MSLKNLFAVAKAIQEDVDVELGPPEEGLVPNSHHVIMSSLTRGSRSYIVSIANQINGAYENGWYDACAVMIRRFVETLLIETRLRRAERPGDGRSARFEPCAEYE